MQNLVIYIYAEGTTGVVRDFANAQNASLPQIVRGIEALFRFRIFAERDSVTPYSIQQLQNIAAWQFAMDSDYSEETNYKLEADNATISVREVEENGYTYTEIAVPMPHTNTVELTEWMGGGKSKSGLVGELVGFDTDGQAVFILQIEPWTVKNRITSAGSPTVIEPDYVTTGEVRGLIAGQVKELTPKIDTDGSWIIDGVDTGLPSRGEPGPQGIAAGFGTPVLNVATGEPGTAASGTVTATGDNTAKVFTFDLTIPQGATGNAAGFGSITATAETIPSDYQASAIVAPGGTNEAKTLAFKFQIPQGAKGDPMKIDATGLSTELSTYDAQLKGFAYLATDTGKVYIKASDSVGDWSDPVGFQGPAGAAAGFATPVVHVTTLEPDEQATASVAASGADTAKTFTFEFGIPQGKQGEKGEQGISGTLTNFKLEITNVTDGNILIDNENAFPVAVYTSNGNCYPIEKESIAKKENGWTLAIDKYLAYDNVSSFTSPWFVYCAGGVKGEDGWNFNPDARGLLSEKSAYDSEIKGFAFLAIDEGNMYFKLSDTPGDWSDAIPFRGPKGEDGMPGANGKQGIQGIQGEPGADGKDGGNFPIALVDTLPETPDSSTLYLIPVG